MSSPRGPGGVLHAHGGFVQELVDDPPGERVEQIPGGGVERFEPGAESVQFGPPDLLTADA